MDINRIQLENTQTSKVAKSNTSLSTKSSHNRFFSTSSATKPKFETEKKEFTGDEYIMMLLDIKKSVEHNSESNKIDENFAFNQRINKIKENFDNLQKTLKDPQSDLMIHDQLEKMNQPEERKSKRMSNRKNLQLNDMSSSPPAVSSSPAKNPVETVHGSQNKGHELRNDTKQSVEASDAKRTERAKTAKNSERKSIIQVQDAKANKEIQEAKEAREAEKAERAKKVKEAREAKAAEKARRHKEVEDRREILAKQNTDRDKEIAASKDYKSPKKTKKNRSESKAQNSSNKKKSNQSPQKGSSSKKQEHEHTQKDSRQSNKSDMRNKDSNRHARKSTSHSRSKNNSTSGIDSLSDLEDSSYEEEHQKPDSLKNKQKSRSKGSSSDAIKINVSNISKDEKSNKQEMASDSERQKQQANKAYERENRWQPEQKKSPEASILSKSEDRMKSRDASKDKYRENSLSMDKVQVQPLNNDNLVVTQMTDNSMVKNSPEGKINQPTKKTSPGNKFMGAKIKQGMLSKGGMSKPQHNIKHETSIKDQKANYPNEESSNVSRRDQNISNDILSESKNYHGKDDSEHPVQEQYEEIFASSNRLQKEEEMHFTSEHQPREMSHEKAKSSHQRLNPHLKERPNMQGSRLSDFSNGSSFRDTEHQRNDYSINSQHKLRISEPVEQTRSPAQNKWHIRNKSDISQTDSLIENRPFNNSQYNQVDGTHHSEAQNISITSSNQPVNQSQESKRVDRSNLLAPERDIINKELSRIDSKSSLQAIQEAFQNQNRSHNASKIVQLNPNPQKSQNQSRSSIQILQDHLNKSRNSERIANPESLTHLLNSETLFDAESAANKTRQTHEENSMEIKSSIYIYIYS